MSQLEYSRELAKITKIHGMKRRCRLLGKLNKLFWSTR
jgi:hypothetical protein